MTGEEGDAEPTAHQNVSLAVGRAAACLEDRRRAGGSPDHPMALETWGSVRTSRTPGSSKRRGAAAAALAGLLFGLALLAAGAVGAAAADLLVTVGEVTDSRAVVWARAPGPGPVTIEVGAAGDDGTRRRLVAEAHAEADLTVKVGVDRLTAAIRYAYRVSAGREAVDGSFATAPAPNAAQPLTLAWSGDLGGAGRCRSPAGYPIFRAMAARHPDLFLFVGDTIYADRRCPVPDNVPGADFRAVDLRGFRAKHRYNRADPAVQALFRSTPVWAIWDDHEVRNNFAGPVEPLMPVGRRAFLEYWPIQPLPDDPYRLYRRVRWGSLAEIFILDTRQYRSANDTPDGPSKTMLGAAQRDWLLAGLRDSDAVWKLVVSSVSLSIPTGLLARDSWANGSFHMNPGGTPTGFEHELGQIVRALGAHRVRNVVWLVADVHRAEVIRHAPLPGLVFHELVAGPLRAGFGRPGLLDDTLRPTRLFAEGGYDNFGELRLDTGGAEVRIVDDSGRVRFDTRLPP